MSKTVRLLALVFGIAASQASAQSERIGEGNSYAIVDSATGVVSYFNSDRSDALSGGQAIMGVELNREFFSNAGSAAIDGTLLPKPTFARSNDTITMTWHLEECTLEQVVYPYQTGEEYKIVTRYFATGEGNMIDVQVQSMMAVPGLPWMYSGMKSPFKYESYIDTVPGHTAFRGGSYLTEAYWRFPPHPVLRPSEMIFGDLRTMCDRLDWYYKRKMHWAGSDIFGVNVLWSEARIPEGERREIGSFMYGAAEFVECKDSISALLFFPKRMITPAGDLASRTLPMYAYLWQSDPHVIKHEPFVQYTATIKGSRGLSVAGLSLTDHLDSMLVLPMNKDELVPGWSLGASIDLVADTSSRSYIARDLEIGIGQVGYTWKVSGCTYSIDLQERAGKDLTSATIVNRTRENGGLDCTSQLDTVVISDVASTAEKGIKSIDHTAENYDVLYLSGNAPLSPISQIGISVKDSMTDGFVTFHVIDGAEHVSDARIEYCTTPDITKPAVALNKDGNGDWIVTVNDDRAWDRRLASIKVIEAHDIEIKERSFDADSSTAMYRIRPVSQESRFRLFAIDRAANISDTISASVSTSTVADLLPETSPNAFVWGQYLVVKNSKAVYARVYDVLGRTITEKMMHSGEDRILLPQLSAGRYYLVLAGEAPIEFIVQH